MPRKAVACKAGLIALGLLAIFAPSASAESLTWNVESDYPRPIELEFYSLNRSFVWPGDEAMALDHRDRRAFTIKCDRGERICYGAWVRGRESIYWGTGRSGTHGCERCCFVCDGTETNLIIFEP